MAIVYNHIRLDNNSVFYVGIGDKESRAYATHDRSIDWRQIAETHGYRVVITHNDIIREEAIAIEKYLIDFYGRIDIGTGTLVNKTMGGNGSVGHIWSEEMRANLSARVSGENNPLYGVRKTGGSNPRAKAVYNTYTGFVYGSYVELAEAIGKSRSLVYKYLYSKMSAPEWFHWKFKDQSLNAGEYVKPAGRSRVVTNIETGEMLPSVLALAKYLNIEHYKVYDLLRGKSKDKNFKWKFKNK